MGKYIKIGKNLYDKQALTYQDAQSLIPNLSIKKYEYITGNKHKYTEKELKNLYVAELRVISTSLELEVKGQTKDELIENILKSQE